MNINTTVFLCSSDSRVILPELRRSLHTNYAAKTKSTARCKKGKCYDFKIQPFKGLSLLLTNSKSTYLLKPLFWLGLWDILDYPYSYSLCYSQLKVYKTQNQVLSNSYLKPFDGFIDRRSSELLFFFRPALLALTA